MDSSGGFLKEWGWNILGECTRERLLAADLLAADEGLDGDGDCAVDVLCGTVL